MLLGLLRWTTWLGPSTPITPALQRGLWCRGGLSLAANVLTFNLALSHTDVSHAALYLGAAPVWALLWENPIEGRSVVRYLAAALSLLGVGVLFWPAFHREGTRWLGEVLALAASILWTNYVRQCRSLGTSLRGVEITAHTMWRAAVWLAPLALMELATRRLVIRADLLLVQTYCVLAGGVAAYILWNNALQHWSASRVLLFNNLIPISVMAWARVCLHEPVTPTFWVATLLVLAGVCLGQANWQKIFGTGGLPID